MFKKILLICSFVALLSTAHAKEEVYLFSNARCPYCIKVVSYLQSHHKVIPIKDVSKDPAALQELVSKGGKRQIPCLYYNGTYLYESGEIIRWIEQHSDLLADAS